MGAIRVGGLAGGVALVIGVAFASAAPATVPNRDDPFATVFARQTATAKAGGRDQPTHAPTAADAETSNGGLGSSGGKASKTTPTPASVATQPTAITFEEVTDVEPAAYTVVSQDLQQVSRPRVVVRIIIDFAEAKETGAAMAAAVRDALSANGDAKVAIVFAYNNEDDTSSVFTRGVAEGSRDGKGWTGNGRLAAGFGGDVRDKEGSILVLIGDATASDGESQGLAFPLETDGALSERSVETQPLSAEEQEYVSTILSQTTFMTESFTTFTELTQNPQIGDDQWTLRMAAVLVGWKTTYESAQSMAVPPAFAEIHATYLEGLSYYASAADDIASGLDSFDASLLNQATQKLALGTADIQEANRLLQELRGSRGIGVDNSGGYETPAA